jgi:hypothetical protein
MMAIADDLKAAQAKATKKPTQKMTTPGDIAAASEAKAPTAPTRILDYATAIGSGRSMGDTQSSTPVGETGGDGGIDPSVQAYIDSLKEKSKADADALAAQIAGERVSAFNILKTEFDQFGLGSLVDGIKGLLTDGTPSSEFALKLRQTPQYQARFSANADRIKAGLAALSPAEYVALEDQYQNVMRNYGLPASYYSESVDPITGIKKQSGFDKLLASDVSASELEGRISTAQQRVINANPEVSAALKQFYPDITNGDILAYTLDPKNALENIKRKVTAAEIGGAAMTPKDAMGRQILTTSQERAMQLAGYGVNKAQATETYSAIGAGLQRGSELASIYGESPYTQTTAEEELFKLSGQTEAQKQRKKVTGLEKAAFSGQTGLSGGALARDRAGGY